MNLTCVFSARVPRRGRSAIGDRSPVRRGGFTTIELITAMVIGLIVSIIGFSGTRIFQRKLPVKSTAMRLSHALSTARSFAVAQNAYYQLTLDLDHENFWIDEISDPLLGQVPPANILTPKAVSPERIDENVRIEGVTATGVGVLQTTGLAYFIFRPDGSADLDGRIYLLRTRDNAADPGNIFTVRLYAPTGQNAVFPGQRL